MTGFVYIVSNTCMPGLLKVGFTTRTLAQRMLELQGTGVPTPFVIEFFAEVDSPAKLEARAHVRLAKCRHGKEFFKCSIARAVEAVKLAIPETAVHLIASGGRGKSSFLTAEETERLQREAAEERARCAREAQQLEARLVAEREEATRIRASADELALVAAPMVAIVEEAARCESVAIWGRVGIAIAGYFLIFLFPPILIVYCIMFCGNTAKKIERERHALVAKLSQADRDRVRAFVDTLSKLQGEGRLDAAAAHLIARQSSPHAVFCADPGRVRVAAHVVDLALGMGLEMPDLEATALDPRTARAVRVEYLGQRKQLTTSPA